FDRPQPRRTLIVTGDPQAVAALQLAASIAPDPALECSAEVVTREQAAAADWDGIALLLWHAPLPEAEAATVQAFIQRGGQAIFFPPREPGHAEFLGARWQDWAEEKTDVPV